MNTKTQRNILILSLSMLPSAGMGTNTPPSIIHDPYGVLQAMQNGDSKKLEVLATSGNKGQRSMALSALYRSQGDFKKSSKASAECVRQARAASSKDIVLICGLLDAGNDLATGRPGKWAYKVAYLRHQLYPAYRQAQGAGFSIAPLEYVARPANFADLPDASYALNRSHATLPLRKLEKGPLAPMPTGIANGVEIKSGESHFQALFDTGSFMTLLDGPTAQLLNAQVRDGWMPVTGGSKQHLGVGTVATLQMGPLKAKNVSFAVSSAPVLNVAGMDLIQQLGAIRLSSTGVRVLPGNAIELSQCSKPLRVASSLMPTGLRLLVPVKVDGKSEIATLDTGSDEYLTRFGGAQPSAPDVMGKGRSEVTMAIGGITHSQRRSVEASIDLGAGAHDRSVRVEKGPLDAPYYVLGMAATADADLLIDFPGRHLCVLKAHL